MNRRSMFLFAAVSLLWGIPYLLIGVALRGVGPVGVVAARVTLGALVLLPFALRRGSLVALLRRRWRALALLAVVELAAPFLLIAFAERNLATGTTGALIATEPLFVLVLARAPGNREPLGGRRLLGAAVGFGGVVPLGLSARDGLSAPLVLGASACYAVGALLINRVFPTEPAGTLTAAMLALASPPLLALAAFTEPAPRLTAGSALALLVLGAACTAGGFAAFFALVNSAGAARAALITYFAPVVAVAAGTLALGERLTLRAALGTGLILLGALLALRTPPGRPPTIRARGPRRRMRPGFRTAVTS